MATTTEATIFSIKWKDAFKGLITAVLTAVTTGLYEIINTGALPTKPQIHVVVIAGIGAGLAYIVKNFLTNSDDKFLKSETKTN